MNFQHTAHHPNRKLMAIFINKDVLNSGLLAKCFAAFCGVFTSVKNLEQKVMEFIEAHNSNPKPFVWTKTTEAILEKIGRAKAALLLH